MTTVVVGGGMAGALVARSLHLAGRDVTVVDAEPEPGGVARSVLVDGYLLEPAVGSLMLPHPVLSPLLDGLAVEVRAAEPTARRRFVRHRGRTVEVRPGPGLVTTPLLSPRGKLRVLAEPFVPRGSGEETVEAFLVRRLGRDAGALASWLMAAGVHAGDPATLSIEAAFPALSHLEREHGSLVRGALARRRDAPAVRPSLHVVTGGTAAVARAVAESLGKRWRSSWRVDHLDRTDSGWRVLGPEIIEAERVVAAVSPPTLAALHSPLGGLGTAPWAPVAVVWLGLRGPVVPEGFGVLVGPDEGFAALGFLFESAYAPDRAPAGRGLVKAIVGGAANPAVAALPADVLVERVADELGQVLGVGVEVNMTHVVRHEPGIPQYTSARRAMVRELRASLPPGLEVCGWAYDGVGVNSLALAARRLALS